jgi:hypothetical protein
MGKIRIYLFFDVGYFSGDLQRYKVLVCFSVYMCVRDPKRK